jgi:hypothetical protein
MLDRTITLKRPAARTRADIKPDNIQVDHEGNLEDRELIENCIIAGQCQVAYQATFRLDPDPNLKHAEPLSAPIARRRDKAIAAATELLAHTVAGLDAKARLAEALFEDQDTKDHLMVEFNQLVAKFLRVFSIDTKRMMHALAVAPGSVIGVGAEECHD